MTGGQGMRLQFPGVRRFETAKRPPAPAGQAGMARWSSSKLARVAATLAQNLERLARTAHGVRRANALARPKRACDRHGPACWR
jgi:hypothetical protein